MNTSNQIDERDYNVEMKQALDRLHDNKDFKMVILDGYFHKRAVDGVSLLAAKSIKQAGHRPDVMESLIAISQLQDFFITINQQGYVTTEEDLEELDALDDQIATEAVA